MSSPITMPNSTNNLLFSFKSIDAIPEKLKIIFEGIFDGSEKLDVNPLVLSGIEKEKCYWFGDTTANYVGCELNESK